VLPHSGPSLFPETVRRTYNNCVALRLLSLLLTALLLASPAEARRRSVHVPRALPDPSTPAGWLFANAHVLQSAEPVPFDADLQPLAALVGDATVIGLGDATHGTHEFSTIKLRMIDFLVRTKGFDVIGFEAPFPVMNRINTYVQGGAGDPRAILEDAARRLSYWFWYTEEMLEVVEWARAYNAQRGTKPPVELVGVDTYDDVTLAADVVAFLRTVDPAYAATAESDYACITGTPTQTCFEAVARIRDDLVAREAQYLSASSPRAYHDAAWAASVVLAGNRDEIMARGTLWARQHRGTSGKVFYWAHNEHVTQAGTSTDAGRLLHYQLGSSYFVLGTMSGPGSFVGWEFNTTTRLREPVVVPLAPIAPGSYEWFFGQRGAAVLLVPVGGDVPDWLRGPATYRWGGSDGTASKNTVSLPLHYDAVVYIDRTTPVADLR
jgi:erythromycin esterase